MSLDAMLIQTCVIVRDPTNGEDAHGNPPTGQTPALVYNGMCRLMEEEETILYERESGAAVTKYKLLLPPDVDVLERDRVQSIKMEDGTIYPTTFYILTKMLKKSTHTVFNSLDLERVS
jgi:hypothetical protein